MGEKCQMCHAMGIVFCVGFFLAFLLVAGSVIIYLGIALSDAKASYPSPSVTSLPTGIVATRTTNSLTIKFNKSLGKQLLF